VERFVASRYLETKQINTPDTRRQTLGSFQENPSFHTTKQALPLSNATPARSSIFTSTSSTSSTLLRKIQRKNIANNRQDNDLIPLTTELKVESKRKTTTTATTTTNVNDSTFSGTSSISSEKSLYSLNVSFSLLRSQLLQWCFVNALAERSFERRESEAERILYSQWIQLESLRKQIVLCVEKLEQTKFLDHFHEILDRQITPQVDTASWSTFVENYQLLFRRTFDTLHRLPTNRVKVESSSEMKSLFQQAQAVLSDLLLSPHGRAIFDEFSSISSLLERLCAVIEEECREFVKCESLLTELQSLSTLQQSLHLHHILEKEELLIPE